VIQFADLPPWLKEHVRVLSERQAELDQARKTVLTYRDAFRKMSYDDCVYILAREFLERRRPRKWIVEQLMGRLNILRNEQFAESIAHLQTWRFKS